jgi:hypothetical protein
MSYLLRISRFGVDKATSIHPTFQDALDRAKALVKVYTEHAVDIYNEDRMDGNITSEGTQFFDGLTDDERDALYEEI